MKRPRTSIPYGTSIHWDLRVFHSSQRWKTRECGGLHGTFAWAELEWLMSLSPSFHSAEFRHMAKHILHTLGPLLKVSPVCNLGFGGDCGLHGGFTGKRLYSKCPQLVGRIYFLTVVGLKSSYADQCPQMLKATHSSLPCDPLHRSFVMNY